MRFYCFFNDTATPEIYTSIHTLSLPDALPILFPLYDHRRLPPRALFGDGADRDLVEDLPPLCLAERAGEDRRILVERDPGQPAADDRLADLFGQVAGALGFRIRLGDPGLEAGDGDEVADRRIDELGGGGGAVIVDGADVGVGAGGAAAAPVRKARDRK